MARSAKSANVLNTDVIVVGAGAAGLMAALAAARAGARVIVLEKAARLGGTAAVSGGIVWAPLNDHMNGSDSREDALAYFGSLEGGDLRLENLAAFVDNAAEALRFLEANSRLRFTPLPGYPDYYGDRPGARREGGRALDSGLFAFSELGEWRDRVATGTIYPLTVAETPLGGATSLPAAEILAERIARDVRGFGQALVAGLLDACLSAGVEIRLNHTLTDFGSSNGRIDRATAVTEGKVTELHATRGIIVATGGFEWSVGLARTFLRGPIAFPASPPVNTGDGLTLMMAAGAALGNMTSAWWCPTIATGEVWNDGSPRAHPVLIERTLPGSLIVNADGVRFCNEAANYSAIAGAFHVFDPNRYAYVNEPAWLIFDHDYKLRATIAGAPPGDDTPAWMMRGTTLGELAAQIGVVAARLEGTVDVFNTNAVAGVDPDFQRGAADYDRFYGDRSRAGAFATLGPLATGPFYAVRLHLGVLGTNGGARTDASARVLGHDNLPIAGLFAAGNCMAGPTGGIYAGAGGTLGPALTYGWLAGRAAASANI